MDAKSVIAIRDALLNDGKNRTVRVIFDNGFNLSYTSDIIKWDDEAEIVVGLTACADGGSYSANLPIEIVCSTYENIQFITAHAATEDPKEGYDLKTVLDAMEPIAAFNDEEKAEILKWYSRLYSHKYELSQENYDPVDIVRGKKGMTLKEDSEDESKE